MTYASLEVAAETAEGQISAEDSVDVFRVRELDIRTEVYGIIAGDTSYTASPWMHNSAFKAAEMNRVFVPLQVSDLDEFMIRMVDLETREVELNFSRLVHLNIDGVAAFAAGAMHEHDLVVAAFDARRNVERNAARIVELVHGSSVEVTGAP